MIRKMWIEELIPEQKELIPIYREKWIEIAFSTELIHRHKAGETVKKLYYIMGFEQPKIHFFRSPDEALNVFIRQIELPFQEKNTSQCWKYLTQQIAEIYGFPLYQELGTKLCYILYSKVEKQVQDDLLSQLEEQLEDRRAGDIFVGIFKYEPMHFISRQLSRHLTNRMSKKFNLLKFLPEYFVLREYQIAATKCVDFCISVLDCDIESDIWEVFKSVLTECGWIYPFEKICFICERPIEIYFDPVSFQTQKKLAIKFSDGYNC